MERLADAGDRREVKLRDAEALERLAGVDTLIVDKTGTLTAGKPALSAVVAAAGHVEADILRLAASLERGSEHPLADAIVSAAADRGLVLSDAQDFDAVTGKGVTGMVAGKRVLLGNRALLDDARDKVRSSIGELRLIGRGLHPAVLDDPEYTRDVFKRLRPNAIEGFGTLVEVRLDD